MTGIYKIINKINNHCYIGQSTKIQQRWKEHINTSKNSNQKGYNYPLYRAFRKYGIENFNFIVLEECLNSQLNDKEKFWINYYKPEYNQTIGGDYKTVPQKLTEKEVKQIQTLLINDPQGEISHAELAKKYNVHKDTIRDINVGRTWHDSSLQYPLHLSKYDSRNKKIKKYYCKDCNKEISKGAIRCKECANQKRKIPLEKMPVTREELKYLIKNKSFKEIGRQFKITDNSVRKWCDKFGFPRKKKEIKNYSDQEWELI